jgi:phosphopentomutase
MICQKRIVLIVLNSAGAGELPDFDKAEKSFSLPCGVWQKLRIVASKCQV